MAEKGASSPRQQGPLAVGIPVIDPVRAFLPRKFWKRGRDFHIYSVEYNTLAASASAAEQQFVVQDNTDFLVLELSCVGATAAAGTAEQTFWPVLAQIVDTGTGQNWFSAPQHLHNVFGRPSFDGAGSHVLKAPRFIPATSTVTVQLTNLEATARRYWLAFIGVKVYKNQKFDPDEK